MLQEDSWVSGDGFQTLLLRTQGSAEKLRRASKKAGLLLCILYVMTLYKTLSILKHKTPGKSTGFWAADLAVNSVSLSSLGFLICKLRLRTLDLENCENSSPLFSNFLLKLRYNNTNKVRHIVKCKVSGLKKNVSIHVTMTPKRLPAPVPLPCRLSHPRGSHFSRFSHCRLVLPALELQGRGLTQPVLFGVRLFHWACESRLCCE